MQTSLRGAISGAAATALMTLVMATGKVRGKFETFPPEETTWRAVAPTGVAKEPRGAPFEAAWSAAHFGYGAALGLAYSAFGRRVLPAHPVASGLTYGALVWGVNYLGVLPALELYPWPREDRKARAGVLIAAHAVFGIALSMLDRRLSKR